MLHSIGFQSSKANSSLFFRLSTQTNIIVLVYVDDILITGDNKDDIQAMVQYLKSIFLTEGSWRTLLFPWD